MFLCCCVVVQEGPHFPVDLENCITLDELEEEEEQSDDSGSDK